MELFTAIETRTSCRQFLTDSIDRQTIQRILAAAGRAPSPLNAQPWQFIVITAKERKQAIHAESERCKTWAFEQSGWKWLDRYRTDFLLQAPVLVAVVGDPESADARALLVACGTGYRPHQVLALGRPDVEPTAVPLLQGRDQVDGRATAYVCTERVCRPPVTEADALVALIDE